MECRYSESFTKCCQYSLMSKGKMIFLLSSCFFLSRSQMKTFNLYWTTLTESLLFSLHQKLKVWKYPEAYSKIDSSRCFNSNFSNGAGLLSPINVPLESFQLVEKDSFKNLSFLLSQ